MPCCLRDQANSQQVFCAEVVSSKRPRKDIVTYIASGICHVAAHTYHSVVHNKHAPVQAEHCETSAKDLKPNPGMYRPPMTYPIGTSCRANAISACMNQLVSHLQGLHLAYENCSCLMQGTAHVLLMRNRSHALFLSACSNLAANTSIHADACIRL